MSDEARSAAWGPAVAAARRRPTHAAPSRPYEQPEEHDLSGDRVVLAATRALLTASSREEAAAVLQTAVRDLGGGVVPARLAEQHPDALPFDVSLGVAEPLLVVVPALSVAALHIGHHLPGLLQDALVSAERADLARRRSELAAVDPLTGVASRNRIAPALERAQPHDVVCMLDLDRFKELNDRDGHAAGDQALEEFGELLRRSVRDADFCGRYGGDEFLVVLFGTPLEVARQRMLALVALWRERPWHGTTASVGIAVVGPDGGWAASRTADAALLAAKRAGRDRVVCAGLS